jgi:hypothetical protein
MYADPVANPVCAKPMARPGRSGMSSGASRRSPSGLAYSMTSFTLPLGIAIRETTKATAITAAMT